MKLQKMYIPLHIYCLCPAAMENLIGNFQRVLPEKWHKIHITRPTVHDLEELVLRKRSQVVP